MQNLQKSGLNLTWPDNREFHVANVSDAVEQLETAVVTLTEKLTIIKDELNEIDQALDKINNQ